MIAIVVGIGYAVQAGRDTTGEDAAAPGESSSSTGTPPGGAASADGDPGVADTYGKAGDPDAPVKVEVFEDFLCPYCGSSRRPRATTSGRPLPTARRTSSTGPSRSSQYSTRSLNAFAVVLDKSGGDVALKFHDRLFENQPEEGAPCPTTSG